MKKILPLFFLFVVSSFIPVLHAQTLNWVWGRNAQSTNIGEGWNVAADGFDNVFITGEFLGTISFGTHTLSANQGAFVAKYDANGNVKWAEGSLGGGAFGWEVTADGSGNSYITGYFAASTSFGSHIISSLGNQDVFLVKYDSSGNALWARSAGGATLDDGLGVATDASGNIYVTGSTSSTSFTAGSITLTLSGIQTFFLVKYDASGNVLWAKNSAGTGPCTGYGVATDSLANVYVAGTFNTPSVSFGSYTLTSLGGGDAFIVKYDSSGNVLWAKSAGGSGIDLANSVATDGANNAYITGNYVSPSITFGSTTLINAGSNDAFLVKYDASGNVVWAKNIGGSMIEKGYSVSTDKHHKIYVSGSFNSPTISIDTITLPRPPGWLDPLFVAGYDSSGHAFLAKALPSGGDDNNGVAVGPTGCVYTGGDFEQTIMIIANDTLVSSSGTENVFVARLCTAGLSAQFISSDTTFCDEPTQCIHFYDHSTGNPTSWLWSFPGGIPSSSTLQNPDSICYYTAGTYPVTLIVTNSAGSDTLTVSPMIIVGGTPLNPTVSVVGGDTLISSHGSSYQWYLNGNVISGATDSSWVANQTGTYSVRITGVGGCSSLSAGTYIDITSILQVGNWQLAVGISPNPSHGKFSVVFNHPCSHGLIKVFNVLGEEIYAEKMQDGLIKKDISLDVAGGVYFLVVAGEKNSVVKKVVVE